MLLISMSVSVDGYICDREGGIAWSTPSDELFRFHLEGVRELDGYLLGRRLHGMMVPWETDPAMRGSADHAAFADVWTALPKVVFTRTLDHLDGNARLATGSIAEELAALRGTVSIGGADLAGQAMRLGLVDEFRLFRHPAVVGGGTPYFPPDLHLDLHRAETRTFPGGVVFERYTRA